MKRLWRRLFARHVDIWTNHPLNDVRRIAGRSYAPAHVVCRYAPGACGHDYLRHSPPHRFGCRRYKPGPWVPVAVPAR